MSRETCAGKVDGFVTCVPPLSYSFGPIQRYGLMCLWGDRSLGRFKLQTYPIGIEVTMVGHFTDQRERTYVIGTHDDQTWMFARYNGTGAWRADLGRLSVAFPCDTP